MWIFEKNKCQRLSIGVKIEFEGSFPNYQGKFLGISGADVGGTVTRTSYLNDVESQITLNFLLLLQYDQLFFECHFECRSTLFG